MLFDLYFVEITLVAIWIEEEQWGIKSAAGRPIRGVDGIDLDEKSRDGEKWLGSGYILEVGVNIDEFEVETYWRAESAMWGKEKSQVGLLGLCPEQFSVICIFTRMGRLEEADLR